MSLEDNLIRQHSVNDEMMTVAEQQVLYDKVTTSTLALLEDTTERDALPPSWVREMAQIACIRCKPWRCLPLSLLSSVFKPAPFCLLKQDPR